MIGYGIIGVPTSTDQCNAPTSMVIPHVTQAKGMEWLGPKCCSGEKHHELCKGELQCYPTPTRQGASPAPQCGSRGALLPFPVREGAAYMHCVLQLHAARAATSIDAFAAAPVALRDASLAIIPVFHGEKRVCR